MVRSHSLKRTENLLENWITFTYVIDSKTVEREGPVCAVHQKKGFTLPTFFTGGLGSTVVKVLCYKSEGRWFDGSNM